jgi:uncharacterized protein
MLYLIDGYNLLHALGVLHGRKGPDALQRARLRLLGTLHGGFGDQASQVTVVFDAANAPPGATEVQDYRGMHVRFAVHQEQADDLIELLIRRASAPRQLTVVSDDHRIQQAARRRHCVAQGCGDFMDWLEQRRRPRAPAPAKEPPAKPQGSSEAETQHWLEEFADLEDSPEMKELFDPFGFEEGGP